MDYFKHYSTASDSKLINHLFDDFGHSGYAYWFLLLELCSENWDGKSAPSFKFHTRIVRQKLRVTPARLESFLTRCQVVAGLSFSFAKSELQIEIPKLAEVKTSRSVIKSNKNDFDVDIDIEIDKDIDTASAKLTVVKNRKPKKNLSKIPPQDFRNSKEVLETAKDRQDSIHTKLAHKGSIMSPEWLVIEHFNKVNKRDLKQVDSNYKLIKQRIKEGFTVEEMKALIDHAAEVWSIDPFWSRLNRPSTLFNGKMDEYLSQATDPRLRAAEEARMINDLFPGCSA